MRVKRGSDQYLIFNSEFLSEKTARTARLLPLRIRIQNSALSHWSDSLFKGVLPSVCAGADGANKRVSAVIDKIHFRTLILHLSNIDNYIRGARSKPVG